MGQETQVDAEMQRLLECAARAAENSYSPYSSFRVGAALRLSNGETVTGTNVENVSYGLTICAERSALVHAVSQCGACRQVLAEFAGPDVPVAFPTTDGTRVMNFAEVLPMAFEMKLK